MLIQELTTPVTWLESSALDTLESRRAMREILHEEGIEKVLLVTHAWHLRVARVAFEHAGLEAVPAPVGFAATCWIRSGSCCPTHRPWCPGKASHSGSAEPRTKS